jgi:hypothetical protein
LRPHKHGIGSNIAKIGPDPIFQPLASGQKNNQYQYSPKNTKGSKNGSKPICGQHLQNLFPTIPIEHIRYSYKLFYSSRKASIGFILAALQAGKNPASAPARIRRKTVLMATVKLMDGLRM